MGNMAEEMAARIAADEGAALPGGDDGAAAPGTETGGTPTQTPPQPPAEATPTDTGGAQPGPVPYTRFKEVNDELASLRPYKELENFGYDPDSLGRLANFDYAFRVDPAGTIAQVVDNLDLPDEDKAAIKEHLGATEADVADQGAGTQPTPTDDGVQPPAWAQPLIEDKQRRDAERTQAEQAQHEEAMNGMLGQLVAGWNELDAKDGIKTPDSVKLSLIASHAAQGQFSDLNGLLNAARKDAMDFRDLTLGDAVRPMAGSRVSVPGGTALPSPPREFRDLKAVNKAVEADIKAGRLPGFTE